MRSRELQAVHAVALLHGRRPCATAAEAQRSAAALTIQNNLARMREWLAHTQHVKPGALMPQVNLTAAQVDRLAAYLESLK